VTILVHEDELIGKSPEEIGRLVMERCELMRMPPIRNYADFAPLQRDPGDEQFPLPEHLG
jgi:hypothetical protein